MCFCAAQQLAAPLQLAAPEALAALQLAAALLTPPGAAQLQAGEQQRAQQQVAAQAGCQRASSVPLGRQPASSSMLPHTGRGAAPTR